ncbi:MAG: hypothetical protein KJ559_01225 [Nanoarchaeota archaeon]|nr:hypothetical protein [Nanoarchaeota archaeon]
MNPEETQKKINEMQNSEKVKDLFSKVVSGRRKGYKTVIEKNKEFSKCMLCEKILEGNEKFCPECREKLKED